MMKTKIKNRMKNIDNDEFVTKHFEELVNKYGGKAVILCNGEIFTGEDAMEKARAKYPKLTPMILNLPRPEFFENDFVL